MNNKITVIDRNGNQIVAQAVSYITLAGESVNNEYLFYTLNEVVNGDLSKIYVAKVNADDLTISDPEWENVKRAMLAIVHQEEVVGLSYNTIVDEQGNGKSFNIDAPRKIALKMDKLIGLQDEYKLALSNPENTSDQPAVGNTQFFDPNLTKEVEPPKAEEVPNAFDGSMNATTVQNVGLPTGPVAPVPNPVPAVEQPAIPVVQEVIAPVTVEQVPPVVETPAAPVVEQPVVSQPTVTVTEVPTTNTVNVIPAQEQSDAPVVTPNPAADITPVMQNIVPASIPSAIDGPAVNNQATPVNDVNENANDYAIPVNKVHYEENEDMDSVIFDQIIQELNQIKSQNSEIRESIRRLTDNVANINTTLSTVDMNNQQGNYNGMINTNMANTTEEVSAISINPEGQVIIPSINEVTQNASQAANVLTNNVLEQPVVSAPEIIEQPVLTGPVIEQPTIPVVPEPVQPQIIEQPVQPVIEQPIAPPVVEQPVIQTPVVEPAPQVIDQTVNSVPTIATVETIQPAQPAPAVIEQPTVNQEPQIIPDVPVMGVNVPEPVIVVPEYDPNAGLPPVVMPMGVSAETNAPAVDGSIVNPLADTTDNNQ